MSDKENRLEDFDPDERDEREVLRDGLLGMGDLPSAPPDPMPGIESRISSKRRRRAVFVSGGVALAAAVATLAAASIGPALTSLRSQEIAPAGQGGTPTGRLPDPNSTAVRVEAGPDSVARETASTHTTVTAQPYDPRLTSQPKDVPPEPPLPGTEPRDPGEHVVANGHHGGKKWRVITTNQGGKLCVTTEIAGAFKPATQCFDNKWPYKQGQVYTSVKSSAGTLFLGATSTRTAHMLVMPDGDGRGSAPQWWNDVVSTSDSAKLKFFAFVLPERYSLHYVQPLDKYGYEFSDHPPGVPTTEPTCADLVKTSEGKSTVVAKGKCFEEFVPGKQGPGYILGDYNLGRMNAVSYRKDGTGKPCVVAKPYSRFGAANFCFDGFPAGERIVWKWFADREIPNQGVLIGFVKPEAYVVGMDMKAGRIGASPIDTPTSDEVNFVYVWTAKPSKVDVDRK